MTFAHLSFAQLLVVLAFGLAASFIGALIQRWITERRIRRKVDEFVALLEQSVPSRN